jgi:hypothetical protein
MTVNASRYQPLFPSEQLLRGFANQPPFKGCGIATDLIVSAWGTLGECQIRPNGRPFGNADFTNQLKVGWRAFTRVADSNGIPDTGDAQRIHRSMFPGLPDLIPLVSRDFDEVEEALKADYAISIAVRLSALPVSSPLRKYTSADHQIPLVGLERGKSRRQDPMHPPGLRYAGEMVPLSDVRVAAKAIENGLVLAWKVPIGGWTQERLAVRGIRDELREAREDVAGLTDRIRTKNLAIADLQRQLSDAGGADCSNPIAAALETERIAIRDSVDARRSL